MGLCTGISAKAILMQILPDELDGPVRQEEAHGAHDDNSACLLLLDTQQYSRQADFPAQGADSN